MSLIMKVKILAGSDISESVKEMEELSRTLGVTIESKFNGIRLLVSPSSRRTEVVDRYFRELETKGVSYGTNISSRQIGNKQQERKGNTVPRAYRRKQGIQKDQGLQR